MQGEWTVRGDGAQHKAITALEPSIDYWITTEKGSEHTFVLENTSAEEQSYILSWHFSGYVGATDPSLVISVEFTNNRDSIILLDKLSAVHRFADDGTAEAKGDLVLDLHHDETFRFVIKCTRTENKLPLLSGTLLIDLEANDNAAEVLERKRILQGKFTEDELIAIVKDNRKQDIAFQEWWRNSLAVSQFYTGGRSMLLHHMVEFLRLERLDPNDVQQRIRREADSDHDRILKKGRALLAEREALAAGSIVAAATSWIPFVGVIVAVVDTGVNLALSKQLEESKKKLRQAVEDDADAKHWLDSFPEIDHGLSLFSDLSGKVGGENFKHASFAESFLWYLQCCAVAGIVKSANQIDKDLRAIGPEEKTDWNYEDILYMLASDLDTPVEAISLIVYETATRFSGMLNTINASKSITALSSGIRRLWRARKLANTRLTRASIASIKEVGRALSTAKSLVTGGKVAGNVSRVSSGLQVLQKIENSSFRQATRAVKFLAIVGLLSGAAEATAAAKQFADLKKQADEIRRSRHEFAAHVKELWLPEDAVHELHNGSHEAGICVYENSHFGGRHSVWYDSVPDLRRYGWDNKISSVKVTNGETWILYPYRNFQGAGRIVRERELDAVGHVMGDNSISSIRKLPDHSPYQVLLFSHQSFSGQMFEAQYDVSDLTKEDYNDKARSMIVVSGKWRFYEHVHFKGLHREYKGYKEITIFDAAIKHKISSLKPIAELYELNVNPIPIYSSSHY